MLIRGCLISGIWLLMILANLSEYDRLTMYTSLYLCVTLNCSLEMEIAFS